MTMQNRWMMRIPATLLLAAAGLKAGGLGVDPVGRMGIFSLAESQLAIILFEIFLGVWLCSDSAPIGAWSVAIFTFVVFTGTSLYLGLVGQTSCGCFGRLSPSPWFAFGLDIVMLLLLGIARPDLQSLWQNRRQFLADSTIPVLGGAGAIILISGATVGAAHVGFGSMGAAIAYFRGERVSVQPALVDIGEGGPGELRTVTVDVKNWTAKPVRIMGGSSDCSCTVLGDLPLTIPANESRTVSVSIVLAEKSGVFTRKAAFLVDDDGYRTAIFRLTGRVRQSSE